MSGSLTGSGTRGPWPVTFLVARREVRTRLRSRAFRITTFLLIASVVVGVVVVSRVSGQSKSVRVAFTGPAQALSSSFSATASALKANVTVSTVADEGQGESDVSAGSLDLLVSGPATAPTAVVKTTLDSTIQAALDAAVRQAALAAVVSGAGLNPSTIAAEVAAARAEVKPLEPTSPRRSSEIILGLITAYFLMYTIAAYGGFVAAGVVEEKATRIVEIILATIRPRQLLAGKVLGIGLTGLLQVGLVGATALFMVHRTHVVSVPAAGAGAIALDVVWFILGFYFYATLFAIGGALVSRQEDIQSVSIFPIVFIVAALLLSYSVVANPTRLLSIALSLVPPFTPILMPARIATSNVAAWQVALAIALVLGAAAGLTALAGRVYANAVLHTGRRMALRDALRGGQ